MFTQPIHYTPETAEEFKYVSGTPEALEQYLEKNRNVAPIYKNAWDIVRTYPSPVILFPAKIKQVKFGSTGHSKLIVVADKSSLPSFEFACKGNHKGVEFGTCVIPHKKMTRLELAGLNTLDDVWAAECVIEEGATIQGGFSFTRMVTVGKNVSAKNVYLDSSQVNPGASLKNVSFRRVTTQGNVTAENIEEARNVRLETSAPGDSITIKNVGTFENVNINGSANITGGDEHTRLHLHLEDFSDFGEVETADYYTGYLSAPSQPIERDVKDYDNAEFIVTCGVLTHSHPSNAWMHSTLCLAPEEHSENLGKCHCMLWYPMYRQGEPLAVAYVNRARGIKTCDILADVPVAYLEEALAKYALEHGKHHVSGAF